METRELTGIWQVHVVTPHGLGVGWEYDIRFLFGEGRVGTFHYQGIDVGIWYLIEKRGRTETIIFAWENDNSGRFGRGIGRASLRKEHLVGVVELQNGTGMKFYARRPAQQSDEAADLKD